MTRRARARAALALSAVVGLLGAFAPASLGAVAYKSGSIKTLTTPGTSIYFTRSSAQAPGDLMVAALQAGSSTASITPPSGWSRHTSAVAGASSMVSTYTKVAGTAEPSSYGFKFTESGEHTGTLASYSGVDPVDPVDAAQSQVGEPRRSIVCPSLDATVPGAMFVCTAAHATGSTLYYPTAMTRRNNGRTGATADDRSIALGDELRADEGPTGTRTVRDASALPGAPSVGTSLLLRPRAGSAAAPGRVYFDGDFDTGDPSQWSGVQRVSPDRLTVVGDVVRQGSHSARFEVQPGDCWRNGSGSCSARAELETDSASLLRFYEGNDRYLGWSTRFDASWPTSSLWAIFIQFHGNDALKPPISMEAAGDHVFTRGYADGAYFTGTRIPLERGVWNDFVMHIKFSSDPGVGFVEVWRNGVQFQERVYRTTLASTYIYPKLGIYSSGSYTEPRVLWHDGFRVGSTYDSVAAPVGDAVEPAPPR